MINIVSSILVIRLLILSIGEVEYGVLTVLTGFVATFAFVNITLSSATQRFIAFELGKSSAVSRADHDIFPSIVFIYLMIVLFLVLVGESIGYWFVATKLDLGELPIHDAAIVYRLSLYTMIIMILGTAFDSLVIAKEQMHILTYSETALSIVKLISALSIGFFSERLLVNYCVVLFVLTTFIRLAYMLYVSKNYYQKLPRLVVDRTVLKSIMKFTSWSFLGALSLVLRNHGINIILNLSFGPIINAARSISNQLNNLTLSVIRNINVALKPQIVKQYSSGNIDRMHKLLFINSKISISAYLIISIPLFLFTSEILRLWLGSFPPLTITFVHLVLINTFFEVLNGPLLSSLQATSRIGKYQMITSSILLLNVPISIIAIREFNYPQVVYFVSIALSLIALFPRFFLVMNRINLRYKVYFDEVIMRVGPAAMVYTLALVIVYAELITNLQDKIIFFFLIITLILLSIYFLGFKQNEREMAMSVLRKKK